MIRTLGNLKAALLLLGALAFLSTFTSTDSIASSAKKLKVVVSIRPVHSLVAGVMVGAGQPQLLVEGSTPHSYSLKPSNARALQQADLVFWIGPSLEQFLLSPLKTLARKARIVSFEKSLYSSFRATRTDLQSHNHPHTNMDPHIWLDPLIAQKMVMQINQTLRTADPAHAALYASNAQRLIQQLDALTQQIKRKLTPVRTRPYVTLHDAFLYFEKRFKLRYAGSIALTPDHAPGARHLRTLRQRIKKQKISCVFSERQARSNLIKRLTQGTRAKTASLDTLGNGLEKGPELYFTLLQNNARAFFSCLRP